MAHPNKFRDKSFEVLRGFLFINKNMLESRYGPLKIHEFRVKHNKEEVTYTIEFDDNAGLNECVAVIPESMEDSYVKYAVFDDIVTIVKENQLPAYEMREIMNYIYGDD